MILLLAGCAHVAPTPAPAEPPPAAPPPAEHSVAELPMSHPGTLTFVNLTTGVVNVRPVADVPETIAWYLAGELRVPVVRVEARENEGAMEITRYAADGALLDVTVSRP